MYRVLMSYLERLPSAKEGEVSPSGTKVQGCIYSPHSLRATTATLRLDGREPIESDPEAWYGKLKNARELTETDQHPGINDGCKIVRSFRKSSPQRRCYVLVSRWKGFSYGSTG